MNKDLPEYKAGYMKAMNDVMDFLTEIDCEDDKRLILHKIQRFCFNAKPRS